ncbi:MAG: COPII-coated vesicle component Emp24 [Amphiamblys sp. WSBS2006]|nr:MAG: COPII-coated vesicle component Emp24 [Amphiamblys sp. WSBS2006]
MKRLFLLFVCSVCGVLITVDRDQEQCFFEVLKKEQKHGVQYHVSSGGDFNIRLNVYDPDGEQIYSAEKDSYGVFSHTAKKDGRYKYCFDNKELGVFSKKVLFNIHGSEKKDGMASDAKKEEEDPMDKNLKKEIQRLNRSLELVRESYEFTIASARRNERVAVEIRSKMVWWSLGQNFFVLGMCAWQIYYLKTFFETRRKF